ncbi:MAG: histidine kinase [Bacteroidota bacterium]
MEQRRSQPILIEKLLIENRIQAHIGFWLTYILFQAFLIFTQNGVVYDALESLGASLVLLPLKILAVYFTLYFLIPRYFFRGHYFMFASGTALLLFLTGFLHRLVNYFIILPIRLPGYDLPSDQFFIIPAILNASLDVLIVLLLTSVIKIFKYWYQEQQVAQAMIEEKLEAELKFLKGQIHPHFLFNTLNNLYALTLKKSDDAPEVVLRLSGMVNYMLYDASAPEVGLEQEIESLHNYIALERIRYGKDLDIFFDVSGDPSRVRIAPLLLLPFVENSFKHGVSESIQDKWIAINLQIKENSLIFKVENSRMPVGKESDNPYQSGGIGLQNVNRRLELLYGEHYELKVREEIDSYLIVLRLPKDVPNLNGEEIPHLNTITGDRLKT